MRRLPEFEEKKHPRGHGGKFARVASGDKAAKKLATGGKKLNPHAEVISRINELQRLLDSFPQRADNFRPKTAEERAEWDAKGDAQSEIYKLKRDNPAAADAIRDATLKAQADARTERSGLTDDETRAVRLYVGLDGDEDSASSSYAFNRDMRDNPDQLNPEFAGLRDTLNAAMAKRPLAEDTKVERLIASKSARAEILAGAGDPEYRYSDSTFMSTSRAGHNTAEEMSNSYGRATPKDEQVIVSMTVPKGTPSVDVANVFADDRLAEEGEILLPPGLRWRVGTVDRSNPDGIPRVSMELDTSDPSVPTAAPDKKLRPGTVAGVLVGGGVFDSSQIAPKPLSANAQRAAEEGRKFENMDLKWPTKQELPRLMDRDGKQSFIMNTYEGVIGDRKRLNASRDNPVTAADIAAFVGKPRDEVDEVLKVMLSKGRLMQNEKGYFPSRKVR